jgi:Cupredoxin-like domain
MRAQYQSSNIITILIFGIFIDKNAAVPQLLSDQFTPGDRHLLGMIDNARKKIGRRCFVALPLVSALSLGATFLNAACARADDTTMLSITIKDHQFDPAELHAPPGHAIAIHVKNLNPIVSEFESSDLHFEKIVPVGSEGVVYVRPLEPGRYNFYDDFHHDTQGFLIVP